MHKQNFESNNTVTSKLNTRFIQKVINIGFLIVMVAVMSSFFSGSEGSGESGTMDSKALGVDPYIGEIAIFPYSFNPEGWARCDGQLLQISQNTALFSLLGTNFGGDGETTFGLPDLRGRVIIHNGQGPGLPNYVLGQNTGQTNTTLTVANLPAHTHSATGTVSYPAKIGQGDDTNPNGRFPASASTDLYADDTNNMMGAAPVTVTVNNTGSNSAFSNLQPSLVVGYYIALQGVFPSPD